MRVIPVTLLYAPDEPMLAQLNQQRVIARLIRSRDDIALGRSGAHAIVSPTIDPTAPIDLKANEFLYVARVHPPARGEYNAAPARILAHTLVAGSAVRPTPIRYTWETIRRVVSLSGLPPQILDKARQDQVYLVAAFVWTLWFQSGSRRYRPLPTPTLDTHDAPDAS